MTDDMMPEFVAEASDHLTRAEEILLGFSRQPDQEDREAINACFRALHTIKGCSGFLDLLRIQHLSHAGEQILDALRTNDIQGSAAVFDSLLLTVARLQAHIAILGGAAVEVPDSDDDCVRQLEAVRRPAASSGIRDVVAAAPVSPADSATLDPLAAINEASTELIVCGPDDPKAVIAIIDRLAQRMLHGPWNPQARPVMTSMRRMIDGLGGQQALEVFSHILDACSHLAAVQSGDSEAATKTVDPLVTGPLVAVVNAPEAHGLLGEFVSEVTELLAHAETTVLGGAPFTSDQVNGVFRAFHTVKGMAAYLGLPEVEREAHRFEAQIQEVRDGRAPANDSFAALVLGGVDAMRELAAGIKRREALGTTAGDITAHGGVAPDALTPVPSPAATPSTPNAAPPAGVGGPRIGDLLVDLGVPRTAVERSAAGLKPGERIGDKLVADGAATSQQVAKAATAQHALKAGGEVFSRVATAKLEDLMNQVGELLIAQAMVQHSPELPPNSQLSQAIGRQGRILRNLQVLALSLRMVPLRGTFQKMARVVYDTAKKLGKQVEFSLAGEDTEIDRTMAEAMGDPLMHMVRNGIDHGIEMPEVRIAAGKPAAGRLRLEAFQAGDDVVIRLIDDGAGMDPQRLRAKAIEKGLIDPMQPMDEQACFQIVFLPGFSTAAKVTDVSGRGVGMDVVRRQVEEANGTVHIASVVGQGTTFTIRLPMTTAILDAMQLKVGVENLLMPIGSIVEMLRPKPGQVQTILEHGQMIQHRERMLPLVHLGTMLGIPGCVTDPERSTLVVIENHGNDFVIQVDAILGQRQVVIKPFEDGLIHHPATSGTTILGDGRVALILNPSCLVRESADARRA